MVDTVMQGGDTDTDSAICGALLGAVQGREAIPDQWAESVLNCRPQAGHPGVRRPRPERFWPVDALDLVDRLLVAPGAESSLSKGAWPRRTRLEKGGHAEFTQQAPVSR